MAEGPKGKIIITSACMYLNDVSTSSVPPPKLGDLAKLRVSNWFKVGQKLGFADRDLKQIKDRNKHESHESHACQRTMFGKWLDDHPSPTAQDVIIALNNAEESRAADELSRKYGM